MVVREARARYLSGLSDPTLPPAASVVHARVGGEPNGSSSGPPAVLGRRGRRRTMGRGRRVYGRFVIAGRPNLF